MQPRSTARLDMLEAQQRRHSTLVLGWDRTMPPPLASKPDPAGGRPALLDSDMNPHARYRSLTPPLASHVAASTANNALDPQGPLQPIHSLSPQPPVAALTRDGRVRWSLPLAPDPQDPCVN